MAILLRVIEEKCLPPGTMRYEPEQVYYWKAFKMTRRFLMRIAYNDIRYFHWPTHIDRTFRKCMKPMTDRFMRVT